MSEPNIDLPHPEITPIPDNRPPAIPALWNFRFTQITENLRALMLAAGKAIQYTTKTGAAILPKGPTADRGDPEEGHLRFNTTTKRYEGGNGEAFGSLGGATGGGNDAVFYENEGVVRTDFILKQNASTAGDITIAPGVTVTIQPGCTWAMK